MLRALTVKNYALIDTIEAEFGPGLVIITGETGAGKSILIDALGLVLGARASSEAVRAGADKAMVEALFDVSGNRKLRAFFEVSELEWSDELIIRREVSGKGQSRCFLNDSPVTLAVQKQVGELLVDLHGQHEHQSLLRVETHIGMVDDFGGLDGIVEEYTASLRRLRDTADRLAELRAREQQLREKREFLLFQANEIDAVAPRSGEEEQLETDLRILENAETLFTATGELYQHLYEGERSVHDLLVIVRNRLHNLAAIDRQFADAASECGSAEAIVSELAKFVQAYNARVEFSPERLEEMRERLGRLSFLKRKYGGTIEATLAHREALRAELALAENFEQVAASLEQEIGAARSACAVLAERLSSKRNEVARKIDKAVVKELVGLGIPHARFTTKITPDELPAGSNDGTDAAAVATRGASRLRLNARGFDNVEFHLSTNIGEEERPLVRVASGGEISRVMLALKSVLAKSDRLPVLVFDEIDVGVSGRIAQAVGASLKNLSGFHQVIVITHLPQIAGFADLHFAVEKSEQNGRACTTLRRLTLDEQVREVAKLMSGAEVTEAGLAGARELMGLN
jgi:DNA repair protein RecN (Recombination protein N)